MSNPKSKSEKKILLGKYFHLEPHMVETSELKNVHNR